MVLGWSLDFGLGFEFRRLGLCLDLCFVWFLFEISNRFGCWFWVGVMRLCCI